MDSYRFWRTHGLRNERGVLVGVDQTQEWILPWWWEHYQRKNRFPVAFVDFGMSFEKKTWCQERGELVPLRIWDFAAEREEMEPALVQEYEENCGDSFWACRNAWFKKPFACLQSPFETTVWVDIDCEIRCSLEPLFTFDGLGLTMDQIAQTDAYPTYSTGVVVFRRSLSLFEKWAGESLKKNHLFRGDQELLSWLIAQEKAPVTVIPPIYNWFRVKGDNSDALIYHWHGNIGKRVIQQEMSRWSDGL